jgi:hypothetical protein
VIVGLSGAVTGTLISLAFGVLSVCLGGKFDLFWQRGVDIWMSLPSLVLLMIIVTIVGTGMFLIDLRNPQVEDHQGNRHRAGQHRRVRRLRSLSLLATS